MMPSDLALILTTAGINAVSSADQAGQTVEITHLAFGDSSWEPTIAATALQNEQDRVTPSAGSLIDDPSLYLSATLTGSTGYDVREIGVFLSDGTLFAIWSHATDVFAHKSADIDLIVSFDLKLNAVPAGSVILGRTSGHFGVPAATTSHHGVVRLATDTDMDENANDVALTPQLARSVLNPKLSSASGVSSTQDATHTYFTFTTSGTFIVSSNPLLVDYLIVGGGGAGLGRPQGPSPAKGGGGAGGLLHGSKELAEDTYQIVVGAGGATDSPFGPTTVAGTSGTSSTALDLVAYGGGVGGNGEEQGSLPESGGSGTIGQGHAGGDGYGVTPSTVPTSAGDGGSGGGGASGWSGGGGGGAGGPGSAGTPPDTNGNATGGAGGPGLAFPNWASATSTGSSGFYAGGGGGATFGEGGAGGGGRGGSFFAGASGERNTGGGGGGAQAAQLAVAEGGNGGSGIVIIRARTIDLEQI